ncbi:tripartite motif-containing protein 2-like [Saccostrea echinata]|uniref:tripartite motif-containing protein 2-like n=1 Tax=Saccostrea echinata TaxID=191078 RepID=UPI002A80284C|nr:tripartite motif-containing protein 2-like [Saccostrea echinata]
MSGTVSVEVQDSKPPDQVIKGEGSFDREKESQHGQDDGPKSNAGLQELTLPSVGKKKEDGRNKSTLSNTKSEKGNDSEKSLKPEEKIGSKLSLKLSNNASEKSNNILKPNGNQTVLDVGIDKGNGDSNTGDTQMREDKKQIKKDKEQISAKIRPPQPERNYRQYLPESEEDIYKYDGDITICPICKKEFSIPKYLPCLHTFCESCIGDYFRKSQGNAKSFRIRCPVCKEFQPGRRSTVPPKEVAHLLPTNHFILNIVARRNIKKCIPCAKDGKTTTSEFWCYFCTESLCNDHAAYHNNLTSRDVHRVRSIKDVSNDVDSAYSPGFCEVHSLQKLKFYCEDHDVAVCDTCRKNYHRECPGLVTADSEAEELRKSEYAQELKDKLQDLEKKSVDMLDKLGENLSDLLSYRKNDEDAITALRMRVSNHFNNLEKKLMDELTLKQKEKEFEIQTEIGIFEKKRETLLFYQSLLELLLNEGIGVQLFIELPGIGQQSNILAEKMHHRTLIMQNSSIHVEFNDIIVQLDSMGSVVEMHTKIKPEVPYVPGSGSWRKLELQSPQPTPRSEALHMKLKQGFLVIRFQSSTITGATVIEGRLVLADYISREIRAYYDNGNRDNSLNIHHLQGNPWDLVEVPTDRDGYSLVITFPQQRKIVLLQWDNAVVFQQLHLTKHECYGITNVGNIVIVACLKHLEIWIVEDDLTMKRKSILHVTGEKVQTVHPADQNRIYYSDSCNNGSFYCITNAGAIVFQYDHPELTFPRGIATDRDGNIYVAGYKSNNIHKLSPEGELKQLIVPHVQLFYRPRVLVENVGSIFVVYGKHKVLELS